MLSSRSVTTFTIANWRSLDAGRISGPRCKVDAVVLHKITAKLPMFPDEFKARWKHLSGLCLADPEFVVPGYVDILLGVDIFSQALWHGQQLGPPGSPSAVDTCLIGPFQGQSNPGVHCKRW